MEKPIYCKFFLSGSCRNGTRCNWKHEKPLEETQCNSIIKNINRKNNIACKFFRLGECTKGDDCLFLHELGRESPSDKVKIVCSFWKNSTCFKGNYCPYLHSEPKVEEEYPCSICLSDCLKENKKFGLLNNCNHIFCLDCIRTWRDSNNGSKTGPVTHTCPVCRVKSFYVIPSAVYAAGEQKKEIEKKYKETLKGIPCKYFKFGKGCCPFYTSCFYSHLNEDGTPAKDIPPPPKKKAKKIDQIDLLHLYLSLLEMEHNYLSDSSDWDFSVDRGSDSDSDEW